jgi:hypothetical protein
MKGANKMATTNRKLEIILSDANATLSANGVLTFKAPAAFTIRVGSKFAARMSSLPGVVANTTKDENAKEYDFGFIAIVTAKDIAELAEKAATAYDTSNHGTYWRKSSALEIMVNDHSCGVVNRTGDQKEVKTWSWKFGAESFNQARPALIHAIKAGVTSKAAALPAPAQTLKGNALPAPVQATK